MTYRAEYLVACLSRSVAGLLLVMGSRWTIRAWSDAEGGPFDLLYVGVLAVGIVGDRDRAFRTESEAWRGALLKPWRSPTGRGHLRRADSRQAVVAGQLSCRDRTP